jgi:ABC-type Fe3+-hydroxamate transport system substrate-binding protein
MIEVVDAIDRQVQLERPAARIVSLVPSETVSVADLVGVDRLVGRTDYCVEPLGTVERVPSVGGTKGFDVDAVKALRPDLVLANKEENSRPQVQALIAAGVPVHVSFPCTLDESIVYLENLCFLLGLDPDAAEPILECRAAARRMALKPLTPPLPVFVPIWKDPWMTFDRGSYASDILEACGANNVFSERARRYPLAADIGNASPWSEERVEARDTRYPRIRLEEVLERGARVVLLPDEPYAFGPADVKELSALAVPHPLIVERVDGKDLFWYGTRAATAIDRLSVLIESLHLICFGARANN